MHGALGLTFADCSALGMLSMSTERGTNTEILPNVNVLFL
jgi:hypothetical protein